MKEYKVPVQSLIDHIKTAVDVDDWAKDMAEDLLKRQEPIAPSLCGSKEPDWHGSWRYLCGKCKKPIDNKDRFCKRCGQAVKWE